MKGLLSSYCIFIPFLLVISGCNDHRDALALGSTERDQVALTATANEIITTQPVMEGHVVKKGEVVVTLQSQQQQTRLTKAQAQQQQALAYLQRLTNGSRPEDIAAAQAQVEQYQANFRDKNTDNLRIKRLFLKKMVSTAERDSAQTQRDIAHAELQAAINELDKLLHGERIEDIKQAQAVLVMAAAEVELQQQILQDYTIVATRNGILEHLPYHVGDRVAKDATVAIITTETVPYARIYVPEPYRVNITAGKKLTIHVDGIKSSYQGIVRWVATIPSFTPYYTLNGSDKARLVYLAEVVFPDSGRELPAGVPVQVEMPHE
ncbi:putative efflux pump membrane fusion protein [Photobacterium piscicola]|uniref:Putative efflux pump membrane fusion protein n=1 Tax=Photobacterium piscicola TaxID=1378299 RepID=A0A1T5HYF9_9GAMM|nr:HlyD family efflux transporter periplasmic adaptor subunit [Photobacterium piscicola]SKC31785.1 putative efflux pump membrane fusion protein [Photobacterium piscicola]